MKQQISFFGTKLIILVGFFIIILSHSTSAQKYWITGGNNSFEGSSLNKFGTNINKPIVFIANSKKWWTLNENGRLHGYDIDVNGSPLHKFEIWQQDSAYINFIDPTQFSTTAFQPYKGFLLGLKNRNAEIRMVEHFPLIFYTNNLERLRVSKDGRIGIGINNPTALLDVNGTLRFRTGAGNGKVLKSDSQGNATWQNLNDDNPNNEIQSLNLSNNNLSLSQTSTSIDLSPYLDDTKLSENEVDAYVSNNGYLSSEVDGDVSNELLNSAVLNGNNLELTDAGGTKTVDLSIFDNSNMSVEDADADPNNEIQSLSLSNNNLSLSQTSTSIDLSPYLDDTKLSEDEVDAYVNNNGYLSSEVDGDVSNELLNSAVLNGNNLELTDAGGTKTVDLSIFDNSNMSVEDADADPNNEIQSLSLSGTSLSLSNSNSIDIGGFNHWDKLGNKLNYIGGNVGVGINPEAQFHIHNPDNESITDVIEVTEEAERLDFTGNDIMLQSKAPIHPTQYSTSTFLMTNKNTGHSPSDGLKVQVTNNNAYFHLQENGSMSFKIKNQAKLTIKENGQLRVKSLSGGQPQGLVVANTQGVLSKIDANSLNDNLGDHKATKTLNMNGHSIKFKDDTKRFDINQNQFSSDGPTIEMYGKNYQADPSRQGRITFITHGDKGDFVFANYKNSWKTNVIIKSNGNVGIGTSNPGNAKLAVKGTIRAIELKIRANGWADFVFDEDYQLKPLVELEKYIKENHHLPDIPSADKVEKEGLSVGEMNKRLLQKVEELTLYIIEQEKRIKKLEQQQ